MVLPRHHRQLVASTKPRNIESDGSDPEVAQPPSIWDPQPRMYVMECKTRYDLLSAAGYDEFSKNCKNCLHRRIRGEETRTRTRDERRETRTRRTRTKQTDRERRERCEGVSNHKAYNSPTRKEGAIPRWCVKSRIFDLRTDRHETTHHPDGVAGAGQRTQSRSMRPADERARGDESTDTAREARKGWWGWVGWLSGPDIVMESSWQSSED